MLVYRRVKVKEHSKHLTRSDESESAEHVGPGTTDTQGDMTM